MSNSKEAKARIKINKKLEEAGWRFFNDNNGVANIDLETGAKITQSSLNELGEDFEKTSNGYLDFLLLDDKNFPLCVLEAKRENIHPLAAKEQARKYAHSKNARFIILSNGNSHYLWDTETGNPEIITEFPTQESLIHRKGFKPNPKRLYDEEIDENYIAVTQKPSFLDDPSYKNTSTRKQFLSDNGIKLLRPYQLKAIKALQNAAKNGDIPKTRFLFEMATGTGKTLTSAAIIKLFLKTGNANRILFLVDRLELEEQAWKNFVRYLKTDYTCVIYKQNQDDWKKAEIVVSTVQSLLSQNKYKHLFSPTDFDLVISDEAHRSIGGNSRAVFEYFIGYKLGLTATPKDYLKHIDKEKISRNDPRGLERRQLLDTYTTFGCEDGTPTYRYSLIDGVKDGYLINPTVIDARTEITTELLSEKGYSVVVKNEEGTEDEETFYHKDFEKKFFSEKTNLVFCQTFLEKALRDPISQEIGKSIIFCVSQSHAARITQMLNDMAMKIKTWEGKYKSDFAVQVTSSVQDAQIFTTQYVNNNLLGQTSFLEGYKSSKARVCVTVGMMTTGYDCEDILNICLMRPIFSPSDFIQIKGRGTRKFTFEYKGQDGEEYKFDKQTFKLFDFFANCEYFEEKFKYDETLNLPQISGKGKGEVEGPGVDIDTIEIFNPDKIKVLEEKPVGLNGMRIDRELFGDLSKVIKEDTDIKKAIDNEQWDKAIRIVREKYENQPTLFPNLDRIRKAESVDRRLTWQEVLERIFGFIDGFKNEDDLLEDECDKFISINKPDSQYVPYIKNYIKAYVKDNTFREIIEKKELTKLNFYSSFGIDELKALNGWRDKLPEYIKDNVNLNTYM